MLIGVDFDNTIVCYDEVFYAVAREQGLIGEGVGRSKGQVRDHLRAQGREEDWIVLQGLVYGSRLGLAPAFPGVRDFFARCRELGVPVCIVSHKTRRPFRGPDYDLHRAALGWLEDQGFFDPAGLGLPRGRVHLELTKADKLGRISELGCTHFIDDLPEFLSEPAFPAATQGLWFNPRGVASTHGAWPEVRSWDQAAGLLGLAGEVAA